MSVVIPITLQVQAVAAPQQPSESVPFLQLQPQSRAQKRRETCSLFLQWAGVFLALVSIACALFALYATICTSSYTPEEKVNLYWRGFGGIVLTSVILFLVGCVCLWAIGRPPATAGVSADG